MFRGGPWDGRHELCELDDGDEPPPVIIVWNCSHNKLCSGHVTVDPEDSDIEFKTAVSYKLAETDEDVIKALYDIGEMVPRDNEIFIEEKIPEFFPGKILAQLFSLTP